MSLRGRDLITIDDFTNAEIEAVLAVARGMEEGIRDQSHRSPGAILATLFFEPSTRTRLSFEAAMCRLGGRVISVVEMGASSLAKGESLADTARVVGRYADLLVIRHPWEGSARLMADFSDVPVINGGDGGHEHPTQTLCDLYTLKREKGRLSGLNVALCGDLLHGRTTHSLAYALGRFGANILCLPGRGLGLPDHVRERLQVDYGCRPEVPPLGQAYRGGDIRLILSGSDAVVLTPNRPHQLSLFTEVEESLPEIASRIDALYVTRLQKERFKAPPEARATEEGAYPIVDKAFLREAPFRKSLVLHPLPRVDELAFEVDSDPRSRYFEQAAWGVPIRMALLSLLLGAHPEPPTIAAESRVDSLGRGNKPPIYRSPIGVRCQNDRCVSVREGRYVVPEFWVLEGARTSGGARAAREAPPRLRCVYCDVDLRPAYAGHLKSRLYRPVGRSFSLEAGKWVFFSSREEAEARGFKAAGRAGRPQSG